MLRCSFFRSIVRWLRIAAVSAPLVGCAVRLAGQTIADTTLQADTLRAVILKDIADSRQEGDEGCQSRKVVNTEVVEPLVTGGAQFRGKWSEQWTLDRCGKRVYYSIEFTTGQAGTFFQVSRAIAPSGTATAKSRSPEKDLIEPVAEAVDRGDYADAERRLLSAIPELERLPRQGDVLAAYARVVLADVYLTRGQTAAAEPLIRAALPVLTKAEAPDGHAGVSLGLEIMVRLGTGDPVAPQRIRRRALVLLSLGDVTRVERLINRELEAAKGRGATPDDLPVALWLGELASLHREQGKLIEAERELRKSLEVLQRVLGPKHPAVGIDLWRLANTELARQNLAEAEPLIRRMVAIVEETLGPEHLALAWSLDQHAKVLRSLGRKSEGLERVARGAGYVARGQLDPAIAALDKALEADPRYASAYVYRGVVHRLKGHYDQAISDYNKALEIDPGLAVAYANRASTYYRKKEYDKAWDDVHKAQELGFKIDPGSLRNLREASGREN